MFDVKERNRRPLTITRLTLPDTQRPVIYHVVVVTQYLTFVDVITSCQEHFSQPYLIELIEMAGPPEERQKQLILQREREREAVRTNLTRDTLMQKLLGRTPKTT
jgi:hypothetical protein